MWDKILPIAMVLMIPSTPFEATLPKGAPQETFLSEGHPLEEVDPIWQMYCDDPRELAKVVTVIYNEGTPQEYYIYYDPDTCESFIARHLRRK